MRWTCRWRSVALPSAPTLNLPPLTVICPETCDPTQQGAQTCNAFTSSFTCSQLENIYGCNCYGCGIESCPSEATTASPTVPPTTSPPTIPPSPRPTPQPTLVCEPGHYFGDGACHQCEWRWWWAAALTLLPSHPQDRRSPPPTHPLSNDSYNTDSEYLPPQG